MPNPPNPFIPTTAAQTRAHVAIVLDRSGSMESCRDATIDGFNEYAEQIRLTAATMKLDVQLTLTVFNDDVRMPLFQQPLARLHPLDRKLYVPGGTTAMLDAVGKTIDRLEQHGSSIEESSVLVCIISDGHENASRRYTYADIADRIQRLMGSERWTFTYLGSNQDLAQVSEALNIPAENMASYAATQQGTSDAWTSHRRATRRRMEEIAEGATASQDFYRDEKAPAEPRAN